MPLQSINLWLASWYPHKLDPFTGDFIQRHAQALATQEPVHVLHICRDTHGEVTRDVAIEQKEHSGVHETIIYYYIDSSGISFWDSWRARKKYLSLGKKWLQSFRDKHHDVQIRVHVAVSMRAGLLAIWFKRRYGYPYLIMEHWTGFYPEHRKAVGQQPPFFWWQMRQIITHASGLLADSRALGSLIQQQYKALPFFEVPNVVDTTLFRPPEHPASSDAFTFLHASTMGYQKNTDGIIRAFLTCRARQKHLRLILMGPAEPLEGYGYSSAFCSNNGITITGNLPYREVAQYMQLADAFVLFSRYENLPCVVLEARCSGLPVIATNVGGIRYHINEDVDMLIAPEDEFALTEAMLKMAEKAKNYDKMLLAVQPREQYNAAAISAKFIDAYSIIFDRRCK